MSTPELHEMTAEIGLGLEPPLSPPVVGGPGHTASSRGHVLTELPSPPPAIRPPGNPEPVSPTVAPETLMASVELELAQPANDLPSLAPAEEALPAMAPQDAPIELEPVRPAETQTVDLPLVAPSEPRPDAAATGARLVVRLRDGDRVEAGEFADFGAAMEGAQDVIEQVTAAAASWPFYAGRFIRPDEIVSVDIVEAGNL